MIIHILPVWVKNPYDCPEVSTVSSSGASVRELSPFILGPVKAFAGAEAQNFENFWQYSKVYKCHVGEDGEPTLEWYDWHAKGFADKRAHRYPMGKGAIPEYSFWNGEHLGYIEARKRIYATFYAKYVAETVAYSLLVELYKEHGEVTLKDYDAYDHIKMGMSLIVVINNPDRKMGHAFVLAMMLEGCLEECIQ